MGSSKQLENYFQVLCVIIIKQKTYHVYTYTVSFNLMSEHYVQHEIIDRDFVDKINYKYSNYFIFLLVIHKCNFNRKKGKDQKQNEPLTTFIHIQYLCLTNGLGADIFA